MPARNKRSVRATPVDATTQTKIHLLDVGEERYGDCILCEVRGKTILIDGAHPTDIDGSTGHAPIPAQIAGLLRSEDDRFKVSLLVISHAHKDHIGCIPEMIERGTLSAEWALLVDPNMAWGHADDSDDAAIDAIAVRESASATPIDRLTALLREEPHPELTDRIAFAVAAADAVAQQQRYRDMIKTLRKRGTKVVLHGRDSVTELQEAMSSIHLKVLGPSKAMIAECRDRIQQIGRDFRADFGPHVGADSDIFDLYQRIQLRIQDSPDAPKGSTGPVINLQSSILVFGDGEHRFLFTGDSQLEDPEVSSASIEASVRSILQEIAANAPYDFVKIGHHGSHNAFGETILEQVGEESLNFGICTGTESTSHPSSDTLKLLRENRDRITWARTDRNGRCTFTFGAGSPTVEVTRRNLNDLAAPGDEPLPVAAPPATLREEPEPRRSAEPVIEYTPTTIAPAPIEIRVPYLPEVGVQITLQIDVRPHGGGTTRMPRAAPEGEAEADKNFRLGGGRTLPQLLFATSEPALARNIGATNASQILKVLRDTGHTVVSTLPSNAQTSKPFHDAITETLRTRRDVAGVVIVGGLDIVPAERRDALPPRLRARINAAGDPDNFIVWSDALYGDSDGDGLPEIPVSRIPDGKSARLVYAALSAPRATKLGSRDGIRNLLRPFADPVFKTLMGEMKALRSSLPQTHRDPRYQLQGDQVYIMLHGDYRDATRFWGETEDQDTVEALNLDNIAVSPGSVVFAGCCWGALTVHEPAGTVATGATITPRTPQDSLALRFLQSGALAFVGCTGVHYSPLEPPYEYFSGPLHRMFWNHLLGGSKPLAPAPALFEAKKEYLRDMPARARTSANEAIERKLFEQFTCLGLGW